MSASVEGAATAVLERFEKHPSYRHVPLADYGRAGLTDLSYPVGMLMFYTLHRLIGHEAFTAAIRGYLERYRGTGGTTRDFVAFVEGSTDRQLGTFFDDWVFSTTWVTRRISAGSMNGLVELYQSGVPSN